MSTNRDQRTTLAVSRQGGTDVLVQGPEVLQEWVDAHTLLVPGHEFTPQFKAGRWDGRRRPGKWLRKTGDNVWSLRCSYGLLTRLEQTFHLQRTAFPAPTIPPNAVDEFLAAHPTHPSGTAWHDYQCEALRAIVEARWGRIALATNAGKGAVIAMSAAIASQAGHAVLVLCDEKAVFEALHDELQSWGLDVATLRAGQREPPKARITLAMVPTLARRVKQNVGGCAEWQAWVAAHGMVLLDEADKATAQGWRSILNHATGSEYRVGFSGTFPTGLFAELELDQLMGGVLVEAKNKVMIERGVSAFPLVELAGHDVTTEVTRYLPRDWWQMTGPERRRWVYQQAILENPKRHAFVTSLIRPDTPTAVIVNRVQHGHDLTIAIPGAVFLDGSSTDAERDATLARFQAGEVRVLIVTRILDRGTNRLGHTVDLIFAGGEGSPRQTLQRIGRGLRRAGGKEFLRLVDVVDTLKLDSDITDRRLRAAEKYLQRAAYRRLSVYKEEGFEVSLQRAT